MTPKPEQRSVALVNNLRGYMNGQIDVLLRTLEDRSVLLEQAFTAEIAHLDDLYSDKLTEDDDALESVLRFDKGYAKTMAAIQVATERLIEAQAHIARVTNTIENHPAFSDNGCRAPYPVADGDATLDREIISMSGATPGKTVVIADRCIVEGSDFQPGTFHIKHDPTPVSLPTGEEHIGHAYYTTKETNHE